MGARNTRGRWSLSQENVFRPATSHTAASHGVNVEPGLFKIGNREDCVSVKPGLRDATRVILHAGNCSVSFLTFRFSRGQPWFHS
jgi:hypothetical protein